jgi:hypothetical protein
MAYATDFDLLKVRPDVLSLGVKTWEAQHAEAADIIDRLLSARWYRQAAEERGIDPVRVPFESARVSAMSVRRLAAYKALELVYTFLMKPGPVADGFEREAGFFRERFEEELRTVLTLGVAYDWDSSGAIEALERVEPEGRHLERC